MSERLSLYHVLQRIKAFTTEEGVNNFILDGPVHDTKTKVLVIAALFPSLTFASVPTCVIASVNGEGRETMPKYHSKILALTVDERIKSFGIPDDAYFREMYTRNCRLQGFPIITISFAENMDSGNEVILLHTITGISPETAVREFQDKSRDRLETLS